MMLDRHEAAHAHLTEAGDLGDRFGNHWLTSTARTQLASLAVKTGHLDEARALLVQSVDAKDDAGLSIQCVTFSLVAHARLEVAKADFKGAALALGAADGLRKRAGLRAWPSMRRGETELVAQVKEKLGSADFEKTFATGSQLNRRDAVALV